MQGIHRGDIWLVSLDPTVGREIKKSRPCVIIQNDYGNKYGPYTIVAPITSKNLDNLKSFEVLLDPIVVDIPKPSKVLLNQIRSVDKKRLRKFLTTIDSETMLDIDEALKISLGLD